MTKPGFYTTTAISLCLSLYAGSSLAQGSQLSAEEMEMFTPAMQECLDSPAEAETCLSLRAAIEDCATDVDSGACELLISDASALSDDPAAQDRTQQVLAELNETLEMLEADEPPESATLDDVSSQELDFSYKEFIPYLGHCSFQPCSHIHEPSCAVKQAVFEEKIHEDRYESYVRLYEALSEREKFL